MYVMHTLNGCHALTYTDVYHQHGHVLCTTLARLHSHLHRAVRTVHSTLWQILLHVVWGTKQLLLDMQTPTIVQTFLVRLLFMPPLQTTHSAAEGASAANHGVNTGRECD